MTNGLFKKWLLAALCLAALGPTLALAEADTFFLGNGHNGSQTVSGSNNVVNSYARVTNAPMRGENSLAVDTVVCSAPPCFSVGDLVMVLQTTGIVPEPSSGDAGPFDLRNSAVGRWELARLSAVSASTLTLSAPLIRSYTSNVTQVIRVPEYTDVTVNSGATLTALAWNGNVGGVLAFLVQGKITNNGMISAAGAGFRGGQPVTDPSGKMGCTDLDQGKPSGAQKGEGIAFTRYGSAQTGLGNVANGAGGGVCDQSGGGGGGHGGAGGVGGYTSVDDGSRNFGGQGGASLLYSMIYHLTFGGGGGAAHDTDGTSKAAGSGGGLIFIRADELQNVTSGAAVTASGAAGNPSDTDAASGGGAGGAIYLRAAHNLTCFSSSTARLVANGGSGGKSNNGAYVGPGGGGGGGRILLQSASTNCTTGVIGATAGTQTDPSAPGVAGTYGATAGAAGNVTTLTGGFAVPAAPVVVTPANGSSTNNTRPAFGGTVTAGYVVYVVIDGVEQDTAATVDASGNWTFTLPTGVTLSEGSHTVAAYAESQGVRSVKSNTNTFTVDTTPPDTTIVTKPANPTNSTTANFSFTSNESPVTYQCSLDGGAFAACSASASFTGLAEGSHTLSVRAIDAAGNVDPTPDSYTWTVDTTPPDTTIASRPANPSNSSTANFTFTSNESPVTYECSLDGGAFAACSASATFTGLVDGSHTLSVRAKDAAGNVDPTPDSYTWKVDTTPPDTTIVSRPTNPTNSTTANFTFTSNESPVTYECSLDGGAYAACSASATFTGLAEGSHTLSVRAKDAAGNVDPTPDSYTWTVDTVAPDTTIVTKPANPTNSKTANFTFTSNESPVTYECSLDGGAYAACSASASFTGLADGSHTLSVRAVDAAGNKDATPDSYTWTVDTVAPDTTIATKPANPSNSSTANFTFTSNESPVTYECSLDGGAYAACSASASFTGLADGSHTLSVRAVDAAGNKDATPDSYTWTVDTVAPDTTIATKPANPTNSKTANFTFTSNESPVTYECSLDGGAYAACSASASFTGLADGSHTLSVRAVDAAGNKDATPDSYTWTVDTVAPDTTIATKPANPSNSSTANFTFTSNESPVTYECSLDGGAYTACSASASFTGLADGSHTLSVRAKDAAGNVDPTPDSYTWTVDTVAPDTTIATKPANPSNSSTANFTFTSNESPVTYECSLDGGAYAACSASASFSGLADGSHTLSVRAVDAAGNKDATPDSYTWTVDTVAPDTLIDSGPPLLSNVIGATFTFHGTEAGSTFQCSLDGVTFTTCTSPFSYSVPADGTYSFEVRAIDPAGNVDPTPATYSWTVDTQAPDTIIDSGPHQPTDDQTTVTFAFHATESGSTFQCSMDGGAFTSCTSPMTYTGLASGSHTFQVVATDAAGNTDPSPASYTWTIDLTKPNTFIDSGPTQPTTNSTSATFVFHSDKAGSTFQCSLDGGALTSCTSPMTYTGLSEGSHTFTVVATDTLGNTDPSPATYTWTVDTTAPDTIIDSGPKQPVGNVKDATFIFHSNDPAATFECRVDSGTFASCTSGQQYTGLADGTHTFEVRAKDAAGNVDPTPASYTWTVDTTAPAAPVITAPAEGSTVDTYTPAITGTSEPGSTVTVTIDGTPVGTTTADASGHWTYTPTTPLSVGDHTVTATATDPAGNTSPSSDTRHFTVATDTTTPETTITSGPMGTVSDHSATFDFTSNEPGVTYECSLDGAAFTPCTSPVTYNDLADGQHTFQVRSKDAAGNVDPTPDTRIWTVSSSPAGGDTAFLGDGLGSGCSATGGDSSLVVMALGGMLALVRRRRARR